MDPYVRSYVKTRVHIDAGNRAWDDGSELIVVTHGGVRKVLLPCSKILYTFEQLKRAGARCDVITLKSLAKAGGEGRWRETIAERKESGIPSNVYVANARSIEYAMKRGKEIPPTRWVGRVGDQITEVRDTIDEVVDDMAADRWRTEFSRGRRRKR
jgi:hypothetical protein